MSGYGVSPYGAGYWGTSASILPTATAEVFASGDRLARIRLDSEPMHASSVGEGDALNPRTWSITEPATGKVYTIMSVTAIDAFTYDILTYEVFPNHYGVLELKALTLFSVNNLPFPVIEQQFTGAYLAAASTNEKKAASLGLGLQDLANGEVAITVGTTLSINTGGDYSSQSGAELVKKLILRRIVSKPGDFFHLPAYGLGLREKEPTPTVDLRKLALQIEEQVNLEPEVAESRASLSYAAGNGTLIISLKVRLKATGDVIQTDMTIPSGAVQF